jgi:UPF0755 protein
MKKFIIFILILAFVGGGAWLFFNEGQRPVDKADKTSKIFVVKPGEAMNSIINDLAAQGFIRNRIVFYLIVKQQGIETKVQAGDFRLSPSMSAYEIADQLTHGTLDKWVTIREGLRKEEVAEIIAKEFDVSETEFTQLAKEGYLFPDTYLIPTNATAQNIIDIMERTFEQKFTPEMKNKAAKRGLTSEQVVILASLVEREARTDADRQGVASIMLKRLENDWPLDLDATVQYALGYDTHEKSWWRKGLYQEDLKTTKSLYNTYLNQGLPPGPICSPGVSSLNAVINADPSTPYWFYIADNTGKTHFAKTTEEHERNVDKYLR